MIDSTSSDLHLIWKTFTDFEGFTGEPDRDLNLFIEEWKKKMAKVQSAGCQYSDLLLGLKLIEKVNLSHDSIVSVISKISSSTSLSESFLTQVVTNIKEQSGISGSTESQRLMLASVIKINKDDQEISEEIEINSNLISCSKCPVKFFDVEKLTKHYREYHPDVIIDQMRNSSGGSRSRSGFLKCPICDKNFMLMETLKKHIINHDESMICSEDEEDSCNQEWVGSSVLDAVSLTGATNLTSKIKKEIKMETCKESESKTDKAFKCRICPKVYPKLWMLNKHMRVHRTTKDYKCPYCDNTYKWDNGLRKHLLRMHLEEQAKQKSQNSQVARVGIDSPERGEEGHNNHVSLAKEENPDSSVTLQKKEKTGPNANPDEKKARRTFPCEICGKSISEDSMKRHIKRTHLAKRFKCNNCKKEFSKLALLERHMKTHNTKHECSICQKVFKSSTQLKFHMDTHKTTRDLICTYCGKKYKTYSVLREHLNLHTKARHMPCNFCDKVFFDYTSRRFHVRRHHTGEKPYKCDFCDMRFHASTRKVQHMRTHTGEKPFPCRVCGRYFRETNTLKRHVRNVHKIDNTSDV